MTCSSQIISIFAFIYWIEIAQTTPLFQGLSIQKGFEVNFKPFQFKPLSIFKEKWSPFGRFGVRKGIQKRDIEASERISPRPIVSPAPVFEYLNEGNPAEERKNIIESSNELRQGSDPVKPLSSNLIRIPLTESFKPPTEVLYTSIGRNPAGSAPPKQVVGEVFGELPPRPVGPIPEPANVLPQQIPIKAIEAVPISFIPPETLNPVPIRPVSPIPLRPSSPESNQPLNPVAVQPMGTVPIRPIGINFGQKQLSPLQVIPLITPPPNNQMNVSPNVAQFSEIPPTDGPLVRGSKVALYFGNVLLQLVSQFLTNARMQFSQFSRQSPPPQVPSIPLPINN